MITKLWVALALTGALPAQDLPLEFLEPLASKAAQKVEVTLDANLLQIASKFLDGKDPDDAKVKSLLVGLKGIYVRSFTFKRAGEYSMADVEKLRAQLKAWNRIVNVESAGENTGVFVKSDGQKIQGLVVVSAEPTELTVVNLVGTIDPDQVKDLGGRFGIPDLRGIVPKPGRGRK